MRDKLTPEQLEERKVARREKRSEFLTRIVGEFIKIAFIAVFFVLVGLLIWCFILMGKSIAVNYLLPMGLATSLVSIFGIYAGATTSVKKSMNAAGITKNKDGTFTKIMEAAVSAAGTILNKDTGAAG